MLMVGRGHVMPFAPSLHVSFGDQVGWYLQIRRTDGKSFGPFCKFHGIDVTPSNIRSFIPNWDTIVWKDVSINQPPVVSFEWVGDDGDFRINICSPDKVSMEELKGRFKSFMESD